MVALENHAQKDPVFVYVEARLENVLSLHLSPDSYCEFGIKKINDGLYQITKPPEDIIFDVESTGNWNVAISSEKPYFTGVNDTTSKIPIDFIGFTIENIGESWDDGLFSHIANLTKDTVIHLTDQTTRVLENGMLNNIGGSNRNSFILRWRFDYEDENLRTKEFSDFDIQDDLYKVAFYLTLSENAPKGRPDK